MIVNIPTAESLNDVALRLYFSAWESVISMFSDFDLVFDSSEGKDFWKQEWAEYLVACQPELQSVCAVIQQSNELALKARICEVSPFLLLMRSEPKFSKSAKDVDSVELPGVVNTFCAETLSDSYIQIYDQVRSLRNKITHLGEARKVFEPDELLRILVRQYIELWKGRAWLRDRVLFASKTRASFFHDGKYVSTHMEVMHELPYDFDALTKSEFKQLFGHQKSTRRYLCHACIYNASTRFAAIDEEACKTAFLNEDGNSLHCIMCGEHFKVTRKPCDQPECLGNVIGDNDDDYAKQCHVCGE